MKEPKSPVLDIEIKAEAGNPVLVQAENIDDLMYKMAIMGKPVPASKQPVSNSQNTSRRSPRRPNTSNNFLAKPETVIQAFEPKQSSYAQSSLPTQQVTSDF